MTSCFLGRCLLLYSSTVREEVSVDGVSNLNWPVGHDFFLDVGDSAKSLERFHLEAVVPIGIVRTLFRTFVILNRVVLSGAILDWVRQASVVGDTILLELIPCLVQGSSVAALVVGVAQHHVFWREDNSFKSRVLDAGSVGQCRSS